MIPFETNFYYKPIKLTLEKVLISPLISITTPVEIAYFSRSSYSIDLPEYLYFGTVLQFDSLLQNVAGSISNCIFVVEGRHTFSSPMFGTGCAFEPSLKFDIDLAEECSSVSVHLDDLKVENQLTYCSDDFLFIESVWPIFLQKGQVRLKLNREVEPESCVIHDTYASFYNNVCTFDITHLPTDLPLEVSIIFKGKQFKMSPYSIRP